MIWGQLLQLRHPIDGLMSLYPALGQQLLSLSPMLEGVNSSQQSLSSVSSATCKSLDYHYIAHERALLIDQICQLPGFEHFLFQVLFIELSLYRQGSPKIDRSASNHVGLASQNLNFAKLLGVCRTTHWQTILFLHIHPS